VVRRTRSWRSVPTYFKGMWIHVNLCVCFTSEKWQCLACHSKPPSQAVLREGSQQEKQACNVLWHWRWCLLHRIKSIVRHIIESSMSASMISITNSRGFVWSRESLCHSTSWQSDPSPLAPALLLPSKEHSGLGDRQRSLPPVRLDQLSQDTEEAPGPQFNAGFWAFEYPGQSQPAGAEPVWPCN